MNQPRRPRVQCLAQTVKDACIKAAANGYENAAVSGLCHQGAQEAAISAIQMLDLDEIVNAYLDGQSL